MYRRRTRVVVLVVLVVLVALGTAAVDGTHRGRTFPRVLSLKFSLHQRREIHLVSKLSFRPEPKSSSTPFHRYHCDESYSFYGGDILLFKVDVALPKRIYTTHTFMHSVTYRTTASIAL